MTAQQIGSYRLLSRVGAGGMGEVHLALDQDGRTVAIKLLHPGYAAADTGRTRLAREVETMRRVRSPYVAEVVDADISADRPYIVTRYVQGRPLAAIVAERGPLGGDDLRRVACGLAVALSAIHAAGVVHRDLKPANVMLVDGEPVVIDFGIALVDGGAQVTGTGAIVGTPGYVAHEVLRGERAGPPADVYAWAATVAFAATGRSPYGTGRAEAIFFRMLHQEPDLKGVPSGLRGLVQVGLARDPAARPSAAQLVSELSQPSKRRTKLLPPAETVSDDALTGSPESTPDTEPVATRPVRSHAARRREERLARVRERQAQAPRRRIRWPFYLAALFAPAVASVDDFIIPAQTVAAHVGYLALLAVAGMVAWSKGRGQPRWTRRLLLGLILAGVIGSGVGALLSTFVPSTVMIFFTALFAVLAIVTLIISS